MTTAPEPPRMLVDALFAVAVALAITLIVAASQAQGVTLSPLAYVFAVGFGALVLLRCRFPRAMVILTVLGVFGYYTLDLPPIGLAVPVFAALLSASEAGRLGWAVGGGAVAYVVSMWFRVRDGQPATFLLGSESISNLALICAAVALGAVIRGRRIQLAQQAEIARLVELEVRQDADARLRAERERLSRDLHDAVGHTMSVIALQAAVAGEAIGHDDPGAEVALERIRDSSTRTLRDLRGMVRRLRDDEGDAHEVVSLRGVDDLLDAARGAGLTVTADLGIAADELPQSVDAAAYRIVQESLTNVVRHARATAVHVEIRRADGDLRVRIGDDGRGVVGQFVVGHGVAGMTERARLLGGRLQTRSDADGFTVVATLPIEEGP